MNEDEKLQKQWLRDLAEEGLSEPSLIHIEAREISDRLSEFLRKTVETDGPLPNTP